MSASVRGHAVTVGMPARPQILCDSIVTGRLRIVVTAAAGLVDPARAGITVVSPRKGALRATARLVVTGG